MSVVEDTGCKVFREALFAEQDVFVMVVSIYGSETIAAM